MLGEDIDDEGGGVGCADVRCDSANRVWLWVASFKDVATISIRLCDGCGQEKQRDDNAQFSTDGCAR